MGGLCIGKGASRAPVSLGTPYLRTAYAGAAQSAAPSSAYRP